MARDAGRGEAVITVLDDGFGIPPELAADVFSESEPGLRTAFCVRLPVS